MSSHEQLVRFAELNGRRVAWAAVGEGPPLVMGGWWMSHLELDWGNRRFRDFIAALARYRTVVRYDPPGAGLSDRDGPPPMSLDDEVAVLAGVVRAVGAESVVMFAGSAGGPIAARYAAEHPRQVERLVLYGTYMNGAAIADPVAREMLTNLVRRHWGLGSRVLADVFMPSATAAERDEFVSFQREAAPAELAARSLEATYTFSVEDSAGEIRSPTAVLHRRDDRAIPFELGRQLAARIPGAVFVPLEGADHLPWYGDAGAVARAVLEFAGVDRPQVEIAPPRAAADTDLSARELVAEGSGSRTRGAPRPALTSEYAAPMRGEALAATSQHAPESSKVALIGLTGALCGANSIGGLKRAFAGFGPLMSVPMYGFYALEPGTQRIEYNVGINVSDAFVARYENAMEYDPLIEASRTTAGAVYNLDLMSIEEWHESVIFRRAYVVHSMDHVVEVPIAGGGEALGALHFAASEPMRDMAGTDLRLAEAVAHVLGLSIARLRRSERDQRDLERALAALEITNTAVAWSGPSPAEPPRLNAAARRLLGEVVDGFRHLDDLRARPPSDQAFSRRADVELHTGERAVLHARSAPLRDAGLVTVLELQPEHALIRREALAGLTPREAEVAGLVVEGLADREIAERLILSHHTVSQHMRAIYRKLGVDSRVALTRLLIAPPTFARRN